MQAYILCGGQSRRMGQDKAQLKLNGKSMANIIASTLKKAGLETVFMVTKSNKNFESKHPFIYDIIDINHPLTGVYTALNHVVEMHAFVICCDLPWISQTDIELLLKGPYPCIATSPQGLQPLCGIYPKSWANKALAYINSNKRAMDFASHTKTISLNAESLKNVNYPCDLGD